MPPHRLKVRHLRTAVSRYQVSICINPEIFHAAGNLYVPMIGQPRVGVIFNPNATAGVHVALLAFLWPVLHGVLPDSISAPHVFVQLWDKRAISTARQTSFVDLLRNLPR